MSLPAVTASAQNPPPVVPLSIDGTGAPQPQPQAPAGVPVPPPGPQEPPKTDAKPVSLLPRQALSMHGNEAALEKPKEKLQPLADRIEAFKASPGASIGAEEFARYAPEVVEAENAIENGANKTYRLSDGEMLRKVQRQPRSLFVRDLFKSISKPGWFA